MPDWSKEIRERLAGVALDPAREASIVEEIGQHLEDRFAELIAGGAAARGGARKAALDELAASPALSRAFAEALPRPAPPRVPPAEDGSGWLSGLGQDLRYGARRLRLEPLFSLVAILSLALGIGANTAIFQLLDAVRLRSLPIASPRELLNVRIGPKERGPLRQLHADLPQLTSAICDRLKTEQKAFSKLRRLGVQPRQPRHGRRGAQRERALRQRHVLRHRRRRSSPGPAPRPRRRCSPAAPRRRSSSASPSGGASSADGSFRPARRSRSKDTGSRSRASRPPDSSVVEVGQAFDVALPRAPKTSSRTSPARRAARPGGSRRWAGSRRAGRSRRPTRTWPPSPRGFSRRRCRRTTTSRTRSGICA